MKGEWRSSMAGWSAAVVIWLASAAIGGEDRNLTTEATVGKLEVVAAIHHPMPTGVTVSARGRVFVNFPRWESGVPFTVAEIRDGKPVPYPTAEINRLDRDNPAKTLVSVQSVVIDAADRLWVLDTGRVEWAAPLTRGPKLVAINLRTNEIEKKIYFPEDVVFDESYLNDVRFDLSRGEEGSAVITDSGVGGLIIVDLASGASWRRLHEHPSTKPVEDFRPIVEGRMLLRRPAEGAPRNLLVASDGLAIGGRERWVYYRPLSSRAFYRVRLNQLFDRTASDEAVAATVETICEECGFASDGLAADTTGAVYLTNYEDNAILRWTEKGGFETIVHDPRALWPDTLALGRDGYLYFTANQLHRQPSFWKGRDRREPPYVVFRTYVQRKPVLIGP